MSAKLTMIKMLVLKIYICQAALTIIPLVLSLSFENLSFQWNMVLHFMVVVQPPQGVILEFRNKFLLFGTCS